MTAHDDLNIELGTWAHRVAAELRLEGFVVDVEGLLAVAGTAAHAIRRPAAPLTTYVAGFAAGRAAASGEDPAAALASALVVATNLSALAAAEQDLITDIPPTAEVTSAPEPDGGSQSSELALDPESTLELSLDGTQVTGPASAVGAPVDADAGSHPDSRTGADRRTDAAPRTDA
jgi:hypothetical protein